MTYKINLKPIEGGHWLATVQGIPGCLTQAPTIALAKERIREALSLWVDDADDAQLVIGDTHLPPPPEEVEHQ